MGTVNGSSIVSLKLPIWIGAAGAKPLTGGLAVGDVRVDFFPIRGFFSGMGLFWVGVGQINQELDLLLLTPQDGETSFFCGDLGGRELKLAVDSGLLGLQVSAIGLILSRCNFSEVGAFHGAEDEEAEPGGERGAKAATS